MSEDLKEFKMNYKEPIALITEKLPGEEHRRLFHLIVDQAYMIGQVNAGMKLLSIMEVKK